MTPEPPSPPAGDRDARTLRLLDLAPHEAIIVRCLCGRLTAATLLLSKLNIDMADDRKAILTHMMPR